jgi:hypothetical protein
MPVRAQIDSSQLRLVARKVKLLDPEIRKEMIKGLKTDLKPYANQIAADVPVLGSPGRMRGWGHSGRLAWGPVQGAAYVTPGGGKGSVARIEIFGRGDRRAAFKYADLAGTKGDYRDGQMARSNGALFYRINGQGRAMVNRLNDFAKLSQGGKGGRFAWAGFMKYRPLFLKVTINRLDSYAQKVGERILL